MELFKKTKGPCIPPTQIVLGSVDLRIPGNQGINWYHCLKGHSENVEMLVFPDNGHNLDKIWARPKNLEAQLIFLGKYSSFA